MSFSFPVQYGILWPTGASGAMPVMPGGVNAAPAITTPSLTSSNVAANGFANPLGSTPQGNSWESMAMLSSQLLSMLMGMVTIMMNMLQQIIALNQRNAMNSWANAANTGYYGSGSAMPISGAGVTQNSAMSRLAQASKQMLARKGSTYGQCVRGVNDTLAMIYGESNIKRVPSAYMEADVLANDSRFQEIKVSKDQLKNLPPGCIIIWGPDSGNPHGHAAITIGNGREISDHEQSLVIKQNSWFRVFIPKG